VAKNDTSFTGGSSHQASVVTKDDQARLLASASAELVDRGKEELKNNLQDKEKLLDNAITSKISQKKFNKDVDAEADSVSLELTEDFSGVVFDQTDAIVAFKKQVETDIPKGYSLLPAQVEAQLLKVDASKADPVLSMSFSGKAVPGLDLENIKKTLVSQRLTKAKEILSKQPGVEDLEISLTPSWFARFGFLPFQATQIKIETVER